MRSNVEVATLNGWGFRRVKQAYHAPKLQTSERDRSFCFQNSLQPVWRRHDLVRELVERHAAQTVGRTVMNLIDLLKSMGFVHEPFSYEAVRRRLDELAELNLVRLLDKALGQLAEDAAGKRSAFENLFLPFLDFWREACAALIEQSLFTMEDQKYVALLLLRAQLEANKRPVGGSRITHVVVDEFQDINPLDLALLRTVTELNGSELTIVGDDDQAIFEWRGATFRYILEPEKYLGGKFDTYILERNYRCPANLLAHSMRLIELNRNRVRKNAFPVRQERAEIDVLRSDYFEGSIDKVRTLVREFAGSGRGPGAERQRLALISRKRAQLIPYQILLASEDIPFCAAEDLQIFLSEAFDRLIEALSVCSNARGRSRPSTIVTDLVQLCNLVKRYPLAKKDRETLSAWLTRQNPRTYDAGIEALSNYRGPLKGPNEEGAMSLAFAAAIRPLIGAQTVSEALDALSDHMTGLDKDYGKSQEDIFYSDPPFFYLARFAERFGEDFDGFIEALERAKAQLAQLPVEEAEAGDESEVWRRPIHLMTALRAKGKEFDTVVLLDVNDGIWPSVHAERPEEKEQERRLFYVAMTRAKRRLLLTVSGRIGERIAVPSPYLAEAGLPS